MKDRIREDAEKKEGYFDRIERERAELMEENVNLRRNFASFKEELLKEHDRISKNLVGEISRLNKQIEALQEELGKTKNRLCDVLELNAKLSRTAVSQQRSKT